MPCNFATRGAAVLLALTVALLGASVSSTAQWMWDEFVFMSDRVPPWSHIYSMKGGAVTQVTDSFGNDWGPRAAPGGGRVAFVSDRDGNEEIYVVDFDGANERRVTTNNAEDWYPSWSPSGTRLVFSTARDGDHEIWIMSLDGSYSTQLTYNGCYDGEPAYSPDGRKIVFSSDRGPKYDIWVMRIDGTGAECLTTRVVGDCYFPSWSPDGKMIAFTNRFGGQQDVYTVPAEGGVAGPLAGAANPACDEWAPSWSPDGNWISFSADCPGSTDVFIVPAAGRVAVNISASPLSVDKYPDFFWPRIVNAPPAQRSWEQANDWMPSGVPRQWDRVWIPNGRSVDVASDTKDIAQLLVDGAVNGRCDARFHASRGIFVGAMGIISGGVNSMYGEGCNVSLSAWPSGAITIDGTVSGGSKAVSSTWTEHGGSVDLLAHSVTVNLGGSVLGGDGGPLNGGGLYHLSTFLAGNGGNVNIAGEEITIGGAVIGGKGGDTNSLWEDEAPRCTYPQDGGNGGSVFLGSGATADLGGTRNLTVSGRVEGGKGGDVVGPHKGEGGDGGDVDIEVQWGLHGTVSVGAGALLAGGNGGGRSMLLGFPVWGGNGGDVVYPSALSGTLAPGARLVRGTGGVGEAFTRSECPCGNIELCGADGFDGQVEAE